jgi:hypothetical protein
VSIGIILKKIKNFTNNEYLLVHLKFSKFLLKFIKPLHYPVSIVFTICIHDKLFELCVGRNFTNRSNHLSINYLCLEKNQLYK